MNFFVLIKYLFNFVSNLVIRYPLPKNVGYMWNYGSISAFFFFLQIVTGIFLAMFYTPQVSFAFYSVDDIMHNLYYGWLIRLIHLNSASFFFLFVYIHMLRGLYYKSYQSPKSITWLTGISIYVLLVLLYCWLRFQIIPLTYYFPYGLSALGLY